MTSNCPAHTFQAPRAARRWRHRLLALAVTCALLAAVMSSSASAATTNSISGRAALTAYRNYLSALVAQLPAARSSEQSMAKSLKCKGTFSKAVQPSASAETALLEEVYADVSLRLLGSTAGPLSTLSAALYRTTWSDRSEGIAIAHYLNAERSLLGLTPSALCTDATAISTAPTTIPTATTTFLAGYALDSSTARTQLTAFARKVLLRNEAAGDARLIGAINRLQKRYATATATLTTNVAETMLTELGISS